MSSQLGDLFDADPVVTFLQQACKQLYSDHRWISFGNTLYQWTGTFYKEVLDEAEYPRLRKFCNSFEVLKENKHGSVLTYPYAGPVHVKQILEWQKMSCTVTAEQINPSGGLNCTNGLLELCWEGKTLSPNLVPHSPDQYYLSEPKVTYDPEADPTEYERLMQCLDFGARNIFERTIAAALDINTVRKYKGRAVRASFCKGDGQNGKDTLGAVTRELFGRGNFSSCSITDWKEYDNGRCFPIYPLRAKAINWPSENADVGRIDQLRGLRAAITGDTITFEPKNRQAYQEPCNAVFLFNVNEAPTLVTTLKANKSRWGIIPFDKTYSDNPGKGELQADPRFKEDPLFIQEKILPAFLNQLLEQLQNVVNEGIDYSCTQHLLEEIQRESSHLLQFAHDAGLHYDSEGKVSITELWERLKQWYIDTGTLIVETTVLKDCITTREKYTWVDQVKRSDRNVKGPNQVAARFVELFPKAKKGIIRSKTHNETFLMGLKFSEESFSAKSAPTGSTASTSEQEQKLQGGPSSTSGSIKEESESTSNPQEEDLWVDPVNPEMDPAPNSQASRDKSSGPSGPTFEKKTFPAKSNGYLNPDAPCFKEGDHVWLSYGKGQACVINPADYPELGQQPKPGMVPVRTANMGEPKWYPAAWVRRAS